MPKFRVEVSNTTRITYEVEAENRSQVHDQFELSDEVPEGWVEVHFSDGAEEITYIRDL